MKYILTFILLLVFGNTFAFDKEYAFTDEEYKLAKETFYIQADEIKQRDNKAMQLSNAMENNIEALRNLRLFMENELARLLNEKQKLLRDSENINSEINRYKAELDTLNSQIKENIKKLEKLKKDRDACTGYSIFDWFLDPLFCKEIKSSFGYKNKFYENEIKKYTSEKYNKENLISESNRKITENKYKLENELVVINNLNQKQKLNETELVKTAKKYADIQDNVMEFNSKFLGFKFLSDNIDSAEYMNNPKVLYPLFLNTAKSYSENIESYDKFLNQYQPDSIQISTNYSVKPF